MHRPLTPEQPSGSRPVPPVLSRLLPRPPGPGSKSQSAGLGISSFGGAPAIILSNRGTLVGAADLRRQGAAMEW